MKVRISITETLIYQEEIIVNQPETMADKQFEEIIDRAERHCSSAKDVAYFLEERGIETVELTTSFPDSPYDEELEITDLTDIKD